MAKIESKHWRGVVVMDQFPTTEASVHFDPGSESRRWSWLKRFTGCTASKRPSLDPFFWGEKPSLRPLFIHIEIGSLLADNELLWSDPVDCISGTGVVA